MSAFPSLSCAERTLSKQRNGLYVWSLSQRRTLTFVPISATNTAESRPRTGRQPATPAAGASAVPAGGGSSLPLPGGLGLRVPQHSRLFPMIDYDAQWPSKWWTDVPWLFCRFLFGVTYVKAR